MNGKEFRISGKKIMLTYDASEDDKAVIQAIYQNMNKFGKVEKYSMNASPESIIVFIQFYTKINVRSIERFCIYVDDVIYKPKVEGVKQIPEEAKAMSDIMIISNLLARLGDREDREFIELLKEQPEYQILKRLELSEYHVFSHLICKLYEPGLTDQAERINTMIRKIKELPYLNIITTNTIQKSVNELNKEQMQEIIYILKGIH